MISTLSIGLAGWQLVALLTGAPRVSKLAHTWPWSLLIWGWAAWLLCHFIWEAHRER